MEDGRKRKNWLIFATSAVMLYVRTVFGVLYSFGIPYLIVLPFQGSSGSIMDVMAFTLILLGALENRKIQRFYRMDITFIPAEELLGFQNDYIILDEYGDSYEEEIFEDEVDITGANSTIHCTAEWYTSHGREFCVFIPHFAEAYKKRFVLEYVDRKWVLPINWEGSIQKEIYEQYMSCNKPNCVEDEVKYTDDEEDGCEYFENY